MSNKKQGLSGNARSPGSITNAQFHDASNSEKNLDGSPGVIGSVVATSTTTTNVKDYAMVRVTNTTGATAFFWAGKVSDAPATPTVTDSFAMPAGHVELFHLGASDDDMVSMAVKASAAGVQIVIIGE